MPKPVSDYKPGRATFAGILIGAFIGVLFGKLFLGAILGLWFGMALDSSNKAKHDAAEK